MIVRVLASLLALATLDACGGDALPGDALPGGSTTCPSGCDDPTSRGESSGSAPTTVALGSTTDDPTTTDQASTSTLTSSADDTGQSTGPMVEPSSARHTPRPLGETSSPQGYWEYLPPAYARSSSHPLLVYLHGIGANGDGITQLDGVLINGPARLIDRDQWPEERPFVVLTPQHPAPGCPDAAEVQAFISYAIEAYAVDPARVYLTGLSCGAIGAWDYLASALDDQVAASVLIAGDGRGAFAAAGCALGVMPLWAFHGEDDDIVDPLGTIEPVQGLAACVPAPLDVQMTLFPGVRHDSWSRVYDLSAGHDIYAWLLSH